MYGGFVVGLLVGPLIVVLWSSTVSWACLGNGILVPGAARSCGSQTVLLSSDKPISTWPIYRCYFEYVWRH
jgi:hypothetical protein